MGLTKQIGNISQTLILKKKKQNDDHMIHQYLWLT